MERIGRYQIVKELGRGAMGVVYLTNDPNIGRPVAIKTIRLGEVHRPEERERLRERLFREARSAGMLSHPGIVTIYDVDQQGDLAYIAMEYVDGPTLDQVLSQPVGMSSEQMFSVLGQAAVALDYAHAKGIVHRDIKPANIMIAVDGTTKVTDFGIAKVSASQHLTITGTIVGTPHYMSPEQVQGLDVDGRSDQFSLAVIAYEMLTGEKPYTGEHLTTVVYKIVAEEPTAARRLNPTLGGAIESAVRKAMAKRPEDRYPTCQEFSQALERACAATEGWRTLPRGGTLSEPTVMDAPRPAGALPPARRARGEETATVERSVASKPGFWAFVMAILVAAGLLALLGWQSMPMPWLGKGHSQPTAGKPAADQKQPAAAAPATPPPPVAETAAANQPVPLPPPPEPAPDQSAQTPIQTQPAGNPQPPSTAAKLPEAPTPLEPPPAEEEKPSPVKRALPAVRFAITVVSSPGGATATLDGHSETACQAPCALRAAPGRHNIAITMPGYQIERREVEVGTGPIELPAVILRAQGGTLLVTSDPPGASILLNGRKLPQITPAQITLTPGTYSVTLEKDGKQITRSVDVRNGMINYLRVPVDQ